MVRVTILIVALFFSSFASGQIDHIKVLVGKPLSDVEGYLDSLLALRSNPYYKIERSVTQAGQLMLKVEFALADGDFYKCSSITCVFYRFDGGVEVCSRQLIMGDLKNCYSNVAYIKDNFDFVSAGKWETKYPSIPFKITATFEKKEGSVAEYYAILYTLVESANK